MATIRCSTCDDTIRPSAEEDGWEHERSSVDALHDARPTPNGVECHECPGFGNYYRGERQCPEDPAHHADPVLILTTPAGRQDDDQWRVGTQNLWVYNADEWDDDDD